MRELTDDLVAFLDSGLSMLAASRDAELRPTVSRAVAIQPGADRGVVTVFLSDAAAASLLALLGPGVPLAFTCTHVATLRTLQLKGIVTRVRPATEDERPMIARQSGGYTDALSVIGFPPSVVRRWVTWPATAAEMRIHSIFEQTPGPGAGQRMESP